MLHKYNIKSCVIILVLVALFIFPFNAIAQSTAIAQPNAIVKPNNNKPRGNDQSRKKPTLQKKRIEKAIKPEGQLPVSAVLSKKIVALEAELSRTKNALIQAGKAGGENEKYIRTLTSNVEVLQGLVSKKDAELVLLDEEIKALKALVSEKASESASLNDLYEKHNDVISCYRTALTIWDKSRLRRGLTGQDRLTISTQLRNTISGCPPI
jgi:hypothetical protein